MSTFELKKTSENEYPWLMKDEELKGLSFKIFSSIENIVKNYERFVPIKQEYNDHGSGWAEVLVKSKLVYKSFKDRDKKNVQDCLEIEFTGGYYYGLKSVYNKVAIKLQSNTKEVDTKFINELLTKFKSFEEIIQKRYEENMKLIFSEL